VQIRRQVSELRDLAAGTLDSVHGLALELRPSVLDDLGLAAAVQRHVATQSRLQGFDLDFHTEGLQGTRLRPETETAIYRIVQEALANVARHSRASSVSVVLERRNETLVAIVEDNGRGFEVDKLLASDYSLGLHGMHERSLLVGAKLTIESSLGGGTTVFVEVPLPQSIRGPAEHDEQGTRADVVQ
jgi:signal transduction histidine kinase